MQKNTLTRILGILLTAILLTGALSILPVSADEIIPGDVDSSGGVDISDARLVLQHLVGKIILTKDQRRAADVNANGKVDIGDARLILQHIVGKPVKLLEGIEEMPYIAVICKGTQHQFWQTVKKGADAAGEEFGAAITFEGPTTESDVADQHDILKAAIAREPTAIALAAVNSEAVKDLLIECKNKGIPVIGFDSGVSAPPPGTVYATATTDHAASAAIAAEKLFDNADFKAKYNAATPENPVIVGLLSQDAYSSSLVSRNRGFINKMDELAAGGGVVTGHDVFNNDNAEAKVKIVVRVPSSTDYYSLREAAETLLETPGLAAIFGSNEGAVEGILAASDGGKEFGDGKYKDIIAIGFDAGYNQKRAVREGWFFGSVTQDPFQMGYLAVKLAFDASEGKPSPGEFVDSGAKWYDSSNIDSDGIKDLVYD
ncbi:MAG: substrate-binding domain-containing protein [Oscillospiraceae bacterium]|nr:substrate-binding domain-containing protein [Oscillospiraceae bacterium]